MKEFHYRLIYSLLIFTLTASECSQRPAVTQNKMVSATAVNSSTSRTGEKIREMADCLGREWFWMEKDEDESRFHADGEEPFYEYTDEETGELLLTLYYDEETKQGKGIRYGYGDAPIR